MTIVEEIDNFCRKEFGRFDFIVIKRFTIDALSDPTVSLEKIEERYADLCERSDANRRNILICFSGLCYIFFSKTFEVSWGPIKLTGLGSILDALLVAVSFLLSHRVVIRFQLEYYAALGRRMIRHRYDPEIWHLKFEESFERPELSFSKFRRAFYFHIYDLRPRRQYADSPVNFSLFLIFLVYMSALLSGLGTVVFDEGRDWFSKAIVAGVVVYSHLHFLTLPFFDNWSTSVAMTDPALRKYLMSYLDQNGEAKTKARMEELREILLMPKVEQQQA